MIIQKFVKNENFDYVILQPSDQRKKITKKQLVCFHTFILCVCMYITYMYVSRRHKADRFEQYVQRLGYANYRQLAQEAIRKMGAHASVNSLLECVIQIEKKKNPGRDGGGSGSSSSSGRR